jgi:WD40 repeat protein
VLRLDAGGPTAFVTALAFSPDGRTLYAAGWDKVVHVWTLDGEGRFVPERRAYRVPVGPGQDGLLNAMALSDDGVWLAVGGTGVFRGQGGFRVPGLVVPALGGMTDEMLGDQGLITVFNTQTGAVRLLRGTRGSVAALAFAPIREGGPARLVSAGRERKDRKADTWAGTARLWDVEQAKCLDAQYLPDPEGRRPSLAVWTARGGGLMAALGWGDGNLYVWDQGNDALRSARDALSDPVAQLPGGDRLVTGLFGAGKARLRLWQAAPGNDPAPSAEEPLAKGQPDVLPWALALVSEGADGTADAAAVVTRRETPRGVVEFGLELLSLQAGAGLGGVRADVPVLWRNSRKLPAVASSLRGRYLAVAGNEEHAILVYRVADLVEGKAQPQVLRGAGALFRAVAFARNDKGMGLLLNARPKKRPGDPPRRPADADLVFDFSRGRLAADPAGWQADVPDAGGWEARQPDPERPAIAVSRDGAAVKEVRLTGSTLPKDVRITDFALLPPGPGRPVPLLAVAWHEHGVPSLGLYNAETGEHLREYRGHTGPISCVAFSGDGRLLVSTSEDQTVCVWSLTNLGRVLGKLGLLPGVAVTARDGGGVTVGRVAADSPARDGLRVGDVIEGLVEGDALRRLDSPYDFYFAISRFKPGDRATLRLRDGDVARDVALTVGQGTDERLPLLSLFFTRPDRSGEREWVGWNPLGPYEAADAHAETDIGWHFNTNRPEAPTRFAAAGEYHDKYYRAGLLADLVARGKLTERAAAPKLPAPKLTVGVREGAGAAAVVPFPDAHGHIVVRGKSVTLVVRVAERSLDSLGAVVWQVDDGPEHAFDLKGAAGQMLTAPLDLARGVHKISVRAREPEGGAEVYPPETRLVRSQPPAPRLKYEGKLSRTVQEPACTLKFDLRAGAAGEPVAVRRTQTVRGQVEDKKEEVVAADPEEPTTLTYDFRLRPGRNLLEIVAVNQKALANFEEAETARLAVEVTLIEKAAPPVITLDGVAPDGAPRGRLLAVRPGRPVRLTVPGARIRGKVEAKEELVKAERAKGDAAAAPLASFEAGRKELTIDEAVKLEPGPQTFTFRAKTAASDEAEAAVTLDYQPPVPTAHLVPPADDKVYGEKDAGETKLEAELTLPDPLHPYEAKVLVDGKEPADAPKVTVDEKARRLTANVPLHPGTNRLQIQLSNKWGALFTSAPVQVQYLRPPRVVKLSAPDESKEPAIDLEAKVRSPRPLLKESVRVEVNGSERQAEATVAEEPPQSGDWTVRARGVALDPGTEKGVASTSQIVFHVSSDEGECREPGKAAVVYRPPVAPPVVTVTEPDEDAGQRVQEADFRVVFRVRSTARITKARLVREGDKPVSADLTTAALDKLEGTYQLKAALTVRLKPGPNIVRVEAANEGGGEVSRPLQVSYVYTPARLVLDSLTVAGGPVLEPKMLPGGRVEFPPAPAGQVQLRGRVVWDREDAPGLGGPRVVHIFVNGFQQQPQPLQPAADGSCERAFQADLLLTQLTDNHVSLGVPGLDENTVTRFTVNCTQPEKAQRLHLLMVSPTEKDPEALEAQLFKVFGVTGTPSHLQTKVFDPVYPYGPQVGDYAGPEFVNQRLLQIQQSIRQRTVAAGLPSADLVVVYYRGRELMDDRGNLFPTGDEQEPALRPDDLAEVFADTPGAYVLLLDVQRPTAAAGGGPDKVASWRNHFPKAAQNATLYRFAWLGSGNVPANERLITALQDAMPESVTLQDVTGAVRKFAAQAPDADKKLRASEYIADEMKVIAVNRR